MLPTPDPTRVLSSVEIDRDERTAEDDLSTSTPKPLTSQSYYSYDLRIHSSLCTGTLTRLLPPVGEERMERPNSPLRSRERPTPRSREPPPTEPPPPSPPPPTSPGPTRSRRRRKTTPRLTTNTSPLKPRRSSPSLSPASELPTKEPTSRNGELESRPSRNPPKRTNGSPELPFVQRFASPSLTHCVLHHRRPRPPRPRRFKTPRLTFPSKRLSDPSEPRE